MCVYLIHLDTPITTPNRSPVRHYLGWTTNLEEREEEHRSSLWEPYADGPRVDEDGITRRGERSGAGSALLAYANHLRISWRVVRTWPDGPVKLERQLKRSRNISALCPECREEYLARRRAQRAARAHSYPQHPPGE